MQIGDLVRCPFGDDSVLGVVLSITPYPVGRVVEVVLAHNTARWTFQYRHLEVINEIQ